MTDIVARHRGAWIEWPAEPSNPRAPNEYDVVVSGDGFDPQTQIRRGPALTLDREAGVVSVIYTVEEKPDWRLKADLDARKTEALATAMAYGNAITSVEINQWAGIESLSWTQQRDEALVVVGGGALDGFAVLPGLAEDKGVTLAAYAEDVLANAARYQAILRAAVHLRRTATARLTDEAIDTTDKLDAAVAALRAVADALAAQLIAA